LGTENGAGIPCYPTMSRTKYNGACYNPSFLEGGGRRIINWRPDLAKVVRWFFNHNMCVSGGRGGDSSGRLLDVWGTNSIASTTSTKKKQKKNLYLCVIHACIHTWAEDAHTLLFLSSLLMLSLTLPSKSLIHYFSHVYCLNPLCESIFLIFILFFWL
jgi:hypothetical protein